DVCWFRPQAILGHHLACPDYRDRHYRQARLDGEQKTAALEARNMAAEAARAFGKDQERQPLGDQRTPPRQDSRALRVMAIDKKVPPAPQVPAEHRKVRERRLRDNAELIR